MKSRLLIIILAIFAAVSCQKEPSKSHDYDFFTILGHTYWCQAEEMRQVYLKFLDESSVEVCRCKFREEDGYVRTETWHYSLQGSVITFVPVSKLSLGVQAFDTYYEAGEHFMDATATFKGQEIVWNGTKKRFLGGNVPETLVFKAYK